MSCFKYVQLQRDSSDSLCDLIKQLIPINLFEVINVSVNARGEQLKLFPIGGKSKCSVKMTHTAS